MRGNRGLLLTGVCLAAVLALGELTAVDLAVQDLFFDFSTGRWAIDSAAPVPRFFFYRLPKLVVAVFGLGLLGWAVYGVRAREKPRLLPPKEALFLFTALAVVPLLIGFGKQVTGVYCPCEIERYGGEMPYVRLFETVPPEIVAVKRGRCFPAAHASGGFALMAFAFIGARRLRNALWGLGWGWILGLYQMARGVHYLSHTVVSMLVAWLLILLIARLFRLDPTLRTSSGS